MRLAYRGANYEYNPTARERLEGDIENQDCSAAWRFHNPKQVLGPQQPLELRYRKIAYQRL